jgi:hypothetical protein
MGTSCGFLFGSLIQQVPDLVVTTMKRWMGCLESFFQPATTTTTTSDNNNNNNNNAKGENNIPGYETYQSITVTVTTSCTLENVTKDDAISSDGNYIPIQLATTINTTIATSKKIDEESRNMSTTITHDDKNAIESIRAIFDQDNICGVDWKWIARMMNDSDILACNILRRNNNNNIKSTFTSSSLKSSTMIHPTAYLIKTLGLSLKLNMLCTKMRTEITSLSDEAKRIADLVMKRLDENKFLTSGLWARRARSNTSRASTLIASCKILFSLMKLNFVCNSGLFHARIMNENENENGNNDNDNDNDDGNGGDERRALMNINKIHAYHEINKELTSEIQKSIKHADEFTKQMIHSEYDNCSNCNAMYHKDSLVLFGNIVQNCNEGSSTSSDLICFLCTDPTQIAAQVDDVIQVLEEDRLSSNPTSSSNNVKKKSKRKKKKKRKKRLTNNNNDDKAGPMEKILDPPNAAASPSSVLLFPHQLHAPESRFFGTTATTSKDGGNDDGDDGDDDDETGSSDSTTFILRDDETEDNSVGSSWSTRSDSIASHNHQTTTTTTTTTTKKGAAAISNDDLVDYLLQTGSIIALNDYMDMLGLDNDDDNDNDYVDDSDNLKEV